jgi:hypothetical protein
LATDQTKRFEEYYKESAKGIGITGYEKQKEVYGFIGLMVTRLALKGPLRQSGRNGYRLKEAEYVEFLKIISCE